MPLPIVVLVSGTGSNLKAVQDAITNGRCDAEIRAVVSDQERAGGLALADNHGIPTEVIRMRDFPDREAWDAALSVAVAAHGPSLVVLAGFMRIMGQAFVQRFRHRAINVHPALLPLFPGIDAPAQAIAARVPLSGCTVHIVDAKVDAGPILAQAVVRVRPSDTPHTLHRRIQVAEHRLLPRVIDHISRGRIVLGDPPRLPDGEQNDDIFCSLL